MLRDIMIIKSIMINTTLVVSEADKTSASNAVAVALEDDTTHVRPNVLPLDPMGLALAYWEHPQWPMFSGVLLGEVKPFFPSPILSCACV